MKTLTLKGAYIFVYTLFLISYNSFAQKQIGNIDLFVSEIDNFSIAKVNTSTNERLLLKENLNPNESFVIYTITDNNIYGDTIKNIPIQHISNTDTILYYPSIRADGIYYIKDTLFVSFGKNIAMYKREKQHFVFSKIFDLFENDTNNSRFPQIIGYDNGKLFIANQRFEADKYYSLAVYDLNVRKITKEEHLYVGNSILLQYYDLFNSFAFYDNTIYFLNLIDPKVYLLDYNLKLKDSIDFSFNTDYQITQKALDTNVTINQSIIDPNRPKDIIYLLETIGILQYYLNTKLTTINDSIILVSTWRANEDSCNIIKINTLTKEKSILLTYPKYGKQSIYTSLSNGRIAPLYKDGMFFNYSTVLDSLEENIVYNLHLYYSPLLNFNSLKLSLRDRKLKETEISLNNYDCIIVFNEFLCKTCFTKETAHKKLLFIGDLKNINKVNALSIYKELQKIYPNSDIYFKGNNDFSKIKKNVLLSPLDLCQ